MEGLTILELQSRMQRGDLSARALVEYYLDRIERFDRDGPRLNSIVELNPDARQIADELDAERRLGRVRGALHGIPIVVKDNIDTGDRMATASGSLALAENIAGSDATLIAGLRTAGALVLGKANQSEWANFRSTHSSSGWSSRGGQTRNPYALDRSPCGSSSGSAVAVAADLCAAAVGTETDGSVVCPSHINGIVGLKPTLGLVSRAGIIPIAHTQDTAGPMARTVSDIAVLLNAMAGVDERDVATQSPAHPFDPSAAPAGSRFDYTTALDPDGLKGARIGIARNYFGFDSRVDQILEACIDVMRGCGAEIVDKVDVIAESKLRKHEIEILLYEFKADLDAYLATASPQAAVHSLDEVVKYNEAQRLAVMPYFGQERMLLARRKGPLTTRKYQRALAAGVALARDGIDRPLLLHKLDALLAPTGSPAWPVDLVNGDNYPDGGFSAPAAVAGYPHLTLPAGYIFGLPVGLSLFASAWQEPRLLRIGYAFERASRVRRPPEYLPTVDLNAPAIS